MTASRHVLPPRGLGARTVLAPGRRARLPDSWATDVLRLAGPRPDPPRPDVAGLADLARLVLERTEPGPVDLVAQSMGGVVAMLVALARPERVRRVVLTATSAGIDLAPFTPED